MKRILQALDHAETKPVVGQDDMKKFLQVVTEGASPHKVALPVQMAMQHYQQPQAHVPSNKSPIKTSVRKFFKEVEVEHTEKMAEKKQLLRQYSQTIAERVLMREFKERPTEDEGKYFYKGDNPNIKGALTKARTNAPGADDDMEALIIQGDRVATNLEKAQAQITRQQEREDELTDILNAAETRFRDLNAKVAAGEIDDQDVVAAQAAQEIEKDVDHAKSQVGQDSGHQDKSDKPKAIDKIKEPTVNKAPDQKPAVKKVNTKDANNDIDKIKEPTVNKAPDQKPAVKKVNTKDASAAIDKMARTKVSTPKVNTKDAGAAIDKMARTPVAQPADTTNPSFPFDPFAHTVGSIRNYPQPNNPNLVPEKPAKDPNQRNLDLKRKSTPKGVQSVGRKSKASSTPKDLPKPNPAEIASALYKRLGEPIPKATKKIDPFASVDKNFGSLEEPEMQAENHYNQDANDQQLPVDQPQPVQQPVQDIQQPAQDVDTQNQKRNEIDSNFLIIRRGLKNHLPRVDIHINGEGITVYRSQMYALIQTLGHINNPKTAYERRDKILSSTVEWFDWVESTPTRKWIGHFDNWWKIEQRRAKQQRLQATGTQELPLNETVLNYLATKEGFPNWIEAKKILDESEFIDLVQRASKLIKQLKENEIPGHSMGFKPGPGSPGMQSNTPDGGHLGLGEKMSSKKTLKNSNPCWTGYHPVGTKKKGGRTVPNCVPTSKK